MGKIRTTLGKAKRKVYNTARKVLRKDENAFNSANSPVKPEQNSGKAAQGKTEQKPLTATNVRENKIRDDSIKTVECLYDKYCSGCGACANLCPKNAIEMKFNAEGFLQPSVDMSLCIECGICKKLCPSINTVYKNSSTPDCYAAYGIDSIRAKSSSGGIFTILAENILAKGGYVCGAAYDGEFTVKHVLISNKKDLDILRKSKYVQSDTGFVYREIKKLLEDDKYVLFCGCGCQVAGLYAALNNKSYEKLYTVDLMCHGSPSPGLFKRYLETHYDKDKIEFVGFREKDYFGWSTEMTVKYDDGTVLRNTRVMDPYYKAFLPCISVREFCGSCSYSKLPRQGDITLADFWGVEKYNRDYTDGKGTSIVSVNNEKGAQIWKDVQSELVLCEPLPLEKVLSTGQPFDKPFKNHPFRGAYFDLIKKGASMEKAYDYAVKRKFDVGIYGMWYGNNYGSVATYYALHEIINSFGLSVLMIDKPAFPNDAEVNPKMHARRFANEHYNISRRYSLKDLRQLNNHVDTFVLGSDQVWNRGVNRFAGFTFYFDFADNTKKKIAYAASFGHAKDFASERERATIRQYIERYDGIGVRESSAVGILNDVFGIGDAVQVLDPVFAADRKIFDDLIDKTELCKNRDSSKKFFTAYILDPTPEKRAAVLRVAEKTGLSPVVMLDGRSPHIDEDKRIIDMNDNLVTVSGVEEWLYYFKYSDFVLTDSCHGMSFAILFDRPLIGIGNRARGVARFESLTELFDIKSHFVYDAKDILTDDKLFEPIDYDAVHRILEAEREKSLSWLKEKLFAPKVINSYCSYPVVDERLDK